MSYPTIDLRRVKTYPIGQRRNLVKLGDLIHPDNQIDSLESAEMQAVVQAVLNARRAGHPVIFMMGAHVIKCGLGPLLIDLMKKGVITHIGGNGAVSIHDTELAMIGETSEDVAMSIEDGSFGMAYETGSFIYRALRLGCQNGMGYGEALGKLIADENLPHRDVSVLYQAYRLGVPMTIHATIGADIIHQHPESDFGILGEATGRDFKVFCASIANLDQGVYLNFGSAVTGAEVFLKAISIARNLGYPVSRFTTANFDLVPLGNDYHSSVGKDKPEYYYRPRKNIVNRPVSMGGQGFHINANHMETVPTLHRKVCEGLKNEKLNGADVRIGQDILNAAANQIAERSTAAAALFNELVNRQPQLKESAVNLAKAYITIAASLERGGFVFLTGNGGSMSDALHISGEMLKSYARPRPLSEHERAHLLKLPEGDLLADNLERGLRAIVLGANLALSSAVENDFREHNLAAAQELNALGRCGDVFVGISTSGKARNVRLAAQTAKAKGIFTVLFTGPKDSPLSKEVDISIHAPGERTDRIQENHILLYHCLCEMLERDFFDA